MANAMSPKTLAPRASVQRGNLMGCEVVESYFGGIGAGVGTVLADVHEDFSPSILTALCSGDDDILEISAELK